MRYSSFSLFLNFLLSLLIIFGSVIVYKRGNFDGISIKKLKKDYIAKKYIRFEDLPKSEQKKYINKDSLEQKSDTISNIDDMNIDLNSLNSVEELRAIVRDLKNRILIVQNDNLLLSNDKAEISQMLVKAKDALKEQKKVLLSKNLEQMNEAEQQHYENISELTTKINDLERENIELLQESTALRDKIKVLNEKLVEKTKK